MTVSLEIINTNQIIQLERGENLVDISRKIGDKIFVASINNEICELFTPINYPSKVEFLDLSSSYGMRCYRKSAALIMLMAANKVLGNDTKIWIEHTINKNYFCRTEGEPLSQQQLDEVKAEMRNIVDANLKVEKLVVPMGHAREIFKKYGLEHRIKGMQYLKTQAAHIYKVGDFYEYLYGPIVPETGYITNFDLVKYKNGFVLQFIDPENPEMLCPLKDYSKLCSIFDECNKWARILNVDSVGALNEAICNNTVSDLIMVCEALHEKKIAEIADNITVNGKQVVLVAGPSSSGKTTFSKRLGIQLRVNGKNPQLISLDDYYLDRDAIPPGPDGKKNFENLDALDVALFNQNLMDLINGKTIQMPQFNFLLGKRQPGRTISLGENDVLIIEGIHGLNPKLSGGLPEHIIYKVYISALTQLNLDEHNRISTTDTRMLRRMVRDYRTRGFDAADTIEIWPLVSRGEEENIFPYQENADVIFNSSLVYELCVLKPFVEPVLFRVDRDSKEYLEANRLLKFLNSFLPINGELVPTNSILREFVGGGYFK